MMSRLRKALNALLRAKIVYSSLEQTDYVIFDAVASEWILPLIPDEKNYFVLESRGQVFYANPRVLFQSLVHLFRTGSIFTAYLAAVLDQLHPKMVVTYIDNSRHFYNLSKYYKSCRFLAIQNAARFDIRHMSNKEGGMVYLPEFACFGRYEIDLYSSIGAKIDKFLPVGSVKSSYYMEKCDARPQYLYDICLVCEPSPGWDDIEGDGFEDAHGIIATYALKFAEEHGKTIHFAGKRAPNTRHRLAEIEWYRKYIGEHAERISANNKQEFSTYHLIDASSVSLGFISTAFIEGMSRKNRCLQCNFTGDEKWDFPLDGVWFLDKSDYPSFEKAMIRLFGMTDEEFYEEGKEMINYMMAYDDQESTVTKLKRVIADATQ